MHSNTETINIGHVALVHDDAPRSLWKLAKVKELHRGSDGNVRSAAMHMNTTRPTIKLYAMAVHVRSENSTEQDDSADRPQRATAIEARCKIASQLQYCFEN